MISKPNSANRSSSQNHSKDAIPEALISELCLGKKAAVDELFNKHYGILMALARLILSRPNVKKGFLTPEELIGEIYQHYPFDKIFEKENFQGLIYKMMENRFRDLRKKGNALKRGKGWTETDLEQGRIEKASLQKADANPYANLINDMVIALTGVEAERLGPILVAFRRGQRNSKKGRKQIEKHDHSLPGSLEARLPRDFPEKVLREKLGSMLDGHLAFQQESEKDGSVAEFFDRLLDQLLEDQWDEIDWRQDLDVIATDLFLMMMSLIELSHNVPWRHDEPQLRGPITFQKNRVESGAVGKAAFLSRCVRLREQAPDQALALSLRIMGDTIKEVAKTMGLTFEEARGRINKGIVFLAGKN